MRTEFLRPIDGLRLAEEYRVLLRPDESEAGANGTVHRLPRFFYEIGSWEEAHEIRLAPHFTLAELMLVDCREARLLLSQFPHYVPCAILLLARFLEAFRREVDAPVFISANGGYRSAGASDWRRKKHSCLGYSGKYLPDWRYFPVRHEVDGEISDDRSVAWAGCFCSAIRT